MRHYFRTRVYSEANRCKPARTGDVPHGCGHNPVVSQMHVFRRTLRTEAPVFWKPVMLRWFCAIRFHLLYHNGFRCKLMLNLVGHRKLRSDDDMTGYTTYSSSAYGCGCGTPSLRCVHTRTSQMSPDGSSINAGPSRPQVLPFHSWYVKDQPRSSSGPSHCP